MDFKKIISGNHGGVFVEREVSMSDQPKRSYVPNLEHTFWKVMAFVFVALFGAWVYQMKTGQEKLDKLNDSQIRTQTLLEVLVKNYDNMTIAQNVINGDVQVVKTKAELLDQRVTELEKREH